MHISLSDEQKLIRENIIAFAQKEINDGVIDRDRLQEFPEGLWTRCGEQKLQGLTVPENLGGAGLDPFSAIITLEALGYASHDGGLNFSICAHYLSCVVPVLKFGTEDQKKKYLPALSSGKRIAVNAMTESSSGSDAFNIKTKAIPQGEDFLISGMKTFSSNGPAADTILLYALTDESKGFHGGITAFVLDKDTPGVKTGKSIEKMGLRSCSMSELYFENVVLKKENIIGGLGGGASVFNYSMEWERIGMAASHIGTMERLLEQSVKYAQTRISSGQPLGKKQAVAHRIANMKMQLEAGRLLVYRAAEGLDKNRDNALNASIAKLFVSEAFSSAALDAVQIHGGNGYMTECGIERTLRDALGSTIYSGTSDIQRNIIAGWLGL
jgi:alkylation response protein AidB-like acyl-CoA dehydrogenase